MVWVRFFDPPDWGPARDSAVHLPFCDVLTILNCQKSFLFSLQAMGAIFVWVRFFLIGQIGCTAALRCSGRFRSLMVTLCGEMRLFGEGELAVIINPFPCNQIQRGYLFFHLVNSLLGHVAQHTRRMKMGRYPGERRE